MKQLILKYVHNLAESISGGSNCLSAVKIIIELIHSLLLLLLVLDVVDRLLTSATTFFVLAFPVIENFTVFSYHKALI